MSSSSASLGKVPLEIAVERQAWSCAQLLLRAHAAVPVEYASCSDKVGDAPGR